jgi:hypothetical protein
VKSLLIGALLCLANPGAALAQAGSWRVEARDLSRSVNGRAAHVYHDSTTLAQCRAQRRSMLVDGRHYKVRLCKEIRQEVRQEVKQ